MHTNLEFPAADGSTLSKLRSSRYKGVVPQHNGRWGAQIYECHRRIWLGTFSDEVAAAQVYDIAAQRFRGAEASTNFKRLRRSDPEDAAELVFLSSRTKSDVVRMLRNHTYHEELQNSRRRSKILAGGGRDANPNKKSLRSKSLLEFLFNKTVTPSDVGKLNRLVIPKQHAERHFPIKKDDKMSINFQDGDGKVWRFTYSYWNSSQSYVMTKGWRLFVKEKGVREGDVVGFWTSVDGLGFKQCLIDVLPRSSREGCFAQTSSTDRETCHDDQVTIRLFGVDICKSDQAGAKSQEVLIDEVFRNDQRIKEQGRSIDGVA